MLNISFESKKVVTTLTMSYKHGRNTHDSPLVHFWICYHFLQFTILMLEIPKMISHKNDHL